VKHLLRSVALRLTLVYAIALAALLIVVGALLWFGTVARLERDITQIIRNQAAGFANAYAERGREVMAINTDRRVGRDLDTDEILLLTDNQMKRLAGNLPAWPREVGTQPGWYRIAIERGGRPSEALVDHAVMPDGAHYLVGRDLYELTALRRMFLVGVLAAAVAVLISGFVYGVLLRKAVLSRIDAIRGTTLAIVEGDLAERLPAGNYSDEFSRLTGAINGMLERIEHLVHGVRNVSNAIAHDLRTPLAELRSRLEDLTRTRPSADITFSELDEAVADIDRVIGIFNALLRLAEIDSGLRRSGFRPVDPAAVLDDVVELYGPSAELKQIRLTQTTDPHLHVAGDPYLLAQAVGNLVDNAVKYARNGGSVTVEARHAGNGFVDLIVADDGPGIPDDEKSKVAERFYRSDVSRGTEGVGLGLSLVAAVARLHHGTFSLLDNAPGLRVVLRLPQSNGTTESVG
jgi:signal transduction histidine kinase